MEQAFDEAQTRGLTEEQALHIALQEVGDGRVLAADIDAARCAEGAMNQRTKSLWLPALITLVGASVSLTATQLWVCNRNRLGGQNGNDLLLALVCESSDLGAVGATCHAGPQDKLQMRLAAGLSPALVTLVVMFLVLPWGLVLDGFHFFRVVHFGLGLINWVGIPAAALLLGALPFLPGNNLTAEMNR